MLEVISRSRKLSSVQFVPLLVFGLSACGARASAAGGAEAMSAPQAPPPTMATQAAPASEAYADAEAPEFRGQLAAPPPTPAAPAQAPTAPSGSPQAPTPGSQITTPVVRREMLDISAQFVLRVEKVKPVLEKVHEMVPRYDGTIANENTNEASGAHQATLTIRIDSARAMAFFAELDRLGEVTSRQITARDIGKEFHDAEILLHNLEATLKRYEEILAKANTVQEVLTIEEHLSRVRGQIESVKGNLRWMRDRAARATVNLTIQEIVPTPLTAVEPEPEPEAKFYPGLRLTYLADFRGGDGDAEYWGAGASVRWSRGIGLDVHGLREVGEGTKGLDIFMATLGGELYSDLLGGGKRRWFNPYLGFRLGYARFIGEDEALAGVTLGTEILKTKLVVVDLEARALGFFFGGDGAHIGVQPSLAASVAF